MKKLLIVFGCIMFFVGGLASAEDLECKYSEGSSLQIACDNAYDAQKSANKWIKIEKDVPLEGAESFDAKVEAFQDSINGQTDKSYKKFREAELLIWKTQTIDGDYSDLEKENMLITATDYFKQAEKLERRPSIHSGGILPGPDDSKGQDGTDYLVNGFLAKFVNGSLVLLFSIGTLIMIIGGLMFLFSSGDSEQLTKAKDTIFWGIVGIVIAVMAYAIVKFVVGLDFGF